MQTIAKFKLSQNYSNEFFQRRQRLVMNLRLNLFGKVVRPIKVGFCIVESNDLAFGIHDLEHRLRCS